jgi:hypothetical protein
MLAHNKHNLMKSNQLYVYKNSFGGPYPLCKLHTRKLFILIIAYIYIYMQVIFMYVYSTYYHNTLSYLTLVILSIEIS